MVEVSQRIDSSAIDGWDGVSMYPASGESGVGAWTSVWTLSKELLRTGAIEISVSRIEVQRRLGDGEDDSVVDVRKTRPVVVVYPLAMCPAKIGKASRFFENPG